MIRQRLNFIFWPSLFIGSLCSLSPSWRNRRRKRKGQKSSRQLTSELIPVVPALIVFHAGCRRKKFGRVQNNKRRVAVLLLSLNNTVLLSHREFHLLEIWSLVIDALQLLLFPISQIKLNVLFFFSPSQCNLAFYSLIMMCLGSCHLGVFRGRLQTHKNWDEA